MGTLPHSLIDLFGTRPRRARRVFHAYPLRASAPESWRNLPDEVTRRDTRCRAVRAGLPEVLPEGAAEPARRHAAAVAAAAPRCRGQWAGARAL
jgi:hypothetical protein